MDRYTISSPDLCELTIPFPFVIVTILQNFSLRQVRVRESNQEKSVLYRCWVLRKRLLNRVSTSWDQFQNYQGYWVNQGKNSSLIRKNPSLRMEIEFRTDLFDDYLSLLVVLSLIYHG